MSSADPIRFWNRETGAIETEQIYGEKGLRWIYGTGLGKLTLHAIVKRALFSRVYGVLMDRASTRQKIDPFLEEYGLDPAEFADVPASYSSFNDFFYRKLKPTARPIDPDPNAVVLPADGRHLVLPKISEANGFFVKGQHFDLARFLGSAELGEGYADGALLFSRLCPVDYHRFHFPVAGTPGPARTLPGSLSSVSPLALRQRLAILWENRRVLTEIDTADLGRVLFVEIGATCVGGIEQTYEAGRPVAKGDEKGYFKFGGSSVAVVFERGRVTFDDDLVTRSAEQVEVYAKMGERIGQRA